MELEIAENQEDYLQITTEQMTPCAIITNSCASISPDSIIKEILGTQILPDAVHTLDGIRSFPWHINTRYYEADISLCVMDIKTLGNQEFADSVNAVIICFDSNSIDGFNAVEQWFTFTKEFHADVQVLLCDQCKSEPDMGGVSKVDAHTWCVQHGFELVELNPEESENSDVEDDFQESLGTKRLIQALQAHLWPNLNLKQSRGRIAPHAGLQNVLNGIGLMGLNSNSFPHEEMPNETIRGTTENSFAIEHSNDSNLTALSPEKDLQRSKNCRKSIAAVKPIRLSDAANFNSDAEIETISSNENASTNTTDIRLEPATSSTTTVGTEATGGAASMAPIAPKNERIDSMVHAIDAMSEDSFEELFQNLNKMKTKAQNLSPSQRKSYAEKMAMAFWRSLGGNDSEIDGLSTSSDEETPESK